MNRATNLSPSNLQAQPHCNQWNIKNGSTPIQITLLDYVRLISLLSIISAAQQQTEYLSPDQIAELQEELPHW